MLHQTTIILTIVFIVQKLTQADIDSFKSDLENNAGGEYSTASNSYDDCVLVYDCVDSMDDLSFFDTVTDVSKLTELKARAIQSRIAKEKVLQRNGLTYNDYRIERLKKLSKEKQIELGIYEQLQNTHSYSTMAADLDLDLTQNNNNNNLNNDNNNNNKYKSKTNPDNMIFESNTWTIPDDLHSYDTCSTYYTNVYSDMSGSTDILSQDADNGGGVTFGVGWEISIIFWTWSETAGLAVGTSSGDVGIYIAFTDGFVFLSIGFDYIAEICYFFDYDNIEGNSDELSFGIDLEAISFGIDYVYSESGLIGYCFTFSFDTGTSVASPISISYTDTDTIVVTISSSSLENKIKNMEFISKNNNDNNVIINNHNENDKNMIKTINNININNNNNNNNNIDGGLYFVEHGNNNNNNNINVIKTKNVHAGFFNINGVKSMGVMATYAILAVLLVFALYAVLKHYVCKNKDNNDNIVSNSKNNVSQDNEDDDIQEYQSLI